MSEHKHKREVPALLVEQLALGELDEAGAARVRSELDGDALARIDASNREILSDYPPEKIAADIRRRIERGGKPARSQAWIPWVAAPVMVAAAALVWIVVRDDDTTTLTANNLEPIDREETRLKGDVEPHLVIDRRTAAGHERLAADQVVASGDLLQVSYVPAGRQHGVIVSIDGAGTVTLHPPREQRR